MIKRNVTKIADGFFIFDEELQNEYLGTCRSTGSIIRNEGSLKLAQYSLSVPIPNDLVLGFVEKIRSFEDSVKIKEEKVIK